MQRSLMRGISYPVVAGQFRRIAHGGNVLSEYKFTYEYPVPEGVNEEPTKLEFHVLPESNPPTNIHVLIGRNGVGKTYLLNNMIEALLNPVSPLFFGNNILGNPGAGGFDFEFSEQDGRVTSFVNIVSVAFSAFDNTKNHETIESTASNIGYSYVGLKSSKNGKSPKHKTTEDLVAEFYKGLLECRANDSKRERWHQMISILESDPMIRFLEIKNNINCTEEEVVKSSFRQLSSGHKIIVLTITKLVELTVERSLVILDEPESHLHPPLLSAFIRSVSMLMIRMNAVAIIATHSPVVLQEVPKKCVWRLSRYGDDVNAERMELETFGENVGLLTHEVFGLEVTSTGFYKMLQEIAEQSDNYGEAKNSFNDELGGEASAILRNLVYIQSKARE